MKKTKSFLYISLAVILLAILAYIFISFLTQGEYWKYKKGVTIEVNNLSKESLPDLKFSYSANQNDYKEIGTIKNLNPRKSAKITGSSEEMDVGDLSIYLQYKINNGGKKEDSVLYFDVMRPSKAVVILNIKEVDPNGFLKYEYRGFNGLFQYGPEEVN